jgi:hypothetical protein
MPNTLGLDDDLDPVEAVVRLEKAFAVKISDDEPRRAAQSATSTISFIPASQLSLEGRGPA